MIREARIIMPVNGRHGAHRYLKEKLTTKFGGYTASAVEGGWVDGQGRLHTEPGQAYDVAVQHNDETTIALLQIARNAGQKQGEKAMYVRLPSGNVEILEID